MTIIKKKTVMKRFEAICFITLIQLKPIDSKYLEYTFYLLHCDYFF